MSQPLTGQRPRAELIAELFDRHAAGLFAYCADQLGDQGSAADAVASVISAAPTDGPAGGPPRSALYAYARREIHRRDIVYAPPVVDPLVDPASALVERTLRELRPSQREVLVLGEVCGLGLAELAWVLDVATDTAEELVLGARHRYRQALELALASTGGRVSKPVADVYGALMVSPLRDVLGRLPWPEPPATLRIHVAGSQAATPAPLFVKPRWPSPPMWPQPLGERDPATSTGLFPTELLTPRAPGSVADHEATTAPMPRLRDPLGALDSARPGRDDAVDSVRQFMEPRRPRSPGRPFISAPPPGEQPFFLSAPVPADLLDAPPATPAAGPPDDGGPPTQVLPAVGDVLVHRGPARPGSADRETGHPDIAHRETGNRETGNRETGHRESGHREAAPLFTPRTRAAEPVYLMPAPAVETPVPPAAPIPELAEPAEFAEPATGLDDRPAAAAVTRPPVTRGTDAPPRKATQVRRGNQARKGRPVRRPARRPVRRPRRDRHHDWAWEAVGFLICVAIAMIVFFSVPMIRP
ncbi:hypothetical protein HII36_32375 [Nonomuraea sp. NN258]|uniref:hypothetical protein n=1 Tax=Nonomuraea antri TaxID=2730852 RepID=UPI001567E5F0|nr:hypothetical protein [Nonomuraea antri]NRQ36495.1 hypothetical protein [Nonomuraea antri]